MDGLITFVIKIIAIIFIVSLAFGFVKETVHKMAETGSKIGTDAGKRLTEKIPEWYLGLIMKLSGSTKKPDNSYKPRH